MDRAYVEVAKARCHNRGDRPGNHDGAALPLGTLPPAQRDETRRCQARPIGDLEQVEAVHLIPVRTSLLQVNRSD